MEKKTIIIIMIVAIVFIILLSVGGYYLFIKKKKVDTTDTSDSSGSSPTSTPPNQPVTQPPSQPITQPPTQPIDWKTIRYANNQSKCLNVWGNNAQNILEGAQIKLYDCNSQGQQLFHYDPNTKQIINKHSQGCLGIDNNGGNPGNKQWIIQQQCEESGENGTNGKYQMWDYTIGRFVLDGTDYCMNLANGDARNEQKIQIMGCNVTQGQPTLGQSWTIQ